MKIPRVAPAGNGISQFSKNSFEAHSTESGWSPTTLTVTQIVIIPQVFLDDSSLCLFDTKGNVVSPSVC